MAWLSTVPAALGGLVSTLRAADALSGVQVSDGPVVGGSAATEVVIVGWTGDDGATEAVEGSDEIGDLGGSRSREQYTIHSAILVTRGSADIAAARTRAYELLAVVGGALAADPRLGGAVMMAQLELVNLRQAQTQRGAQASVLFDVAVDAFTAA